MKFVDDEITPSVVMIDVVSIHQAMVFSVEDVSHNVVLFVSRCHFSSDSSRFLVNGNLYCREAARGAGSRCIRQVLSWLFPEVSHLTVAKSRIILENGLTTIPSRTIFFFWNFWQTPKSCLFAFFFFANRKWHFFHLLLCDD